MINPAQSTAYRATRLVGDNGMRKILALAIDRGSTTGTGSSDMAALHLKMMHATAIDTQA